MSPKGKNLHAGFWGPLFMLFTLGGA